MISGNSRPDGSGTGVLIEGPANLIEGNFIGTDQSGGFPLGNDTGVFIYYGYTKSGKFCAPVPRIVSIGQDRLGVGITPGA